MTKALIPFERITYGTKTDGTAWLATVISNFLIPDYDLEFCNKEELLMRYSWKHIAMATYIKKHVRKSGEYVLDLRTKEIRQKPFYPRDGKD